MDTTELEAKLSTARNETQLELLHTVSKGEQAQKASLNTKADSSRLEQYIESAEARRQQVCIHRESVAHSRLPPSPPSSPPETRSSSLAYGLTRTHAPAVMDGMVGYRQQPRRRRSGTTTGRPRSSFGRNSKSSSVRGWVHSRTARARWVFSRVVSSAHPSPSRCARRVSQ